MEREDPDSGLGAAAASCVTAHELLCVPESPFSVREVGEDRVASRVLSSSLVLRWPGIPAATPTPRAGTLAELTEKPSVGVSEHSGGLAPQLDETQAGQWVLRVSS